MDLDDLLDEILENYTPHEFLAAYAEALRDEGHGEAASEIESAANSEDVMAL